MKLRLPEYYKQFHCIADKCKDSCCSAGWEIDIDTKTLDFYNQVQGELGEKLKKNIITNPTPHFKLNNNGNCPFLNENKLCELYLELGKDSLCAICTEHPRYYEYFNEIKEGGIGLCCEESARIILSQTDKFSTYEIEIPFESAYEYDEEIYEYLCNAREKIIDYLDNPNIPLNSKMKDILWYANMIQQNIYSDLLDDEEIISVTAYLGSSIKPILEFLTTLEPNNPNWITYLKNNIGLYNDNLEKQKEFESENPEILTYLKNIAIYFIWRYFLKGTFDEDVLSKIKLMVVSIASIRALFFCKWLKERNIKLDDCIEISKKFSEEIEYSEDNIFALTQAFHSLDIFNTEALLGLF